MAQGSSTITTAQSRVERSKDLLSQGSDSSEPLTTASSPANHDKTTKRPPAPSWQSEDDEDWDAPPRKKIGRKSRGPRPPPPPIYKASVKELADTGTAPGSSAAADRDNPIIQRIKKCLDKANHPLTPEQEAKAAFYFASRLMRQINITQADILAHEPPSVQKEYAGQSVVSIQRVDGDTSRPVRHLAYVTDLGSAMEVFFDCESFSTATATSLQWTFYGIAENTIAAAMAFESAYNMIAEWAQRQKGGNPRNSYCLGVSEELWRRAVREKRDEEAEAKRAEEKALAARAKQEE